MAVEGLWGDVIWTVVQMTQRSKKEVAEQLEKYSGARSPVVLQVSLSSWDLFQFQGEATKGNLTWKSVCKFVESGGFMFLTTILAFKE